MAQPSTGRHQIERKEPKRHKKGRILGGEKRLETVHQPA
jgi:hypothetical protein